MGILEVIFDNVWIVGGLMLLFLVANYAFENNWEKPGPWGLPLVGYLPFLNPGLLYRQLFEFSHKHGPVFQIRLGMRNALVISDRDLILEAFNHPHFIGRPETGITAVLAEGGESQLAFHSVNRAWIFKKKLLTTALDTFHVTGQRNLHSVVASGSAILKQKIRESKGGAMEPRQLFQGPAMAIMSGLSFGRPVDVNDPFLGRVDEFFNQLMDYQSHVELLTFFPALKWVFRADIANSLRIIEDFTRFLRSNLTSGALAGSLAQSIRDAPSDEKASLGLRDEDLTMLAVDLFDGGSVTLAENLSWLLLLMALNTRVQDKVHIILDYCQDPNRDSNEEDELSFPYLQACVLEALRFASNLPFALPHTATDYADFHGFRIAPGTLIMSNLWAVHRDPKHFPEPNKFVPERFLSQSGGVDRGKAERLMSFSVGKRRCPGEGLAKMILHLLFIDILRDYRVELAKSSEPYSPLEPTAAFSLAPGPHKLIFLPRSNNNHLRGKSG